MKIVFAGNYEHYSAERGRSADPLTVSGVLRFVAWSTPIVIVFALTRAWLQRVTGTELPGVLQNVPATVTALLFLPVHELLHISLLPRNATVKVIYSIRRMFVAVSSDAAMSRIRASAVALFPLVTLGLVPLIAVVVAHSVLSQTTISFVLTFSFFSCATAVGDLNELRSILKKPKGSMVTLG